MVKIMILFCLSSVDRSACTIETAYRRMPGPTVTAAQCALAGQTILAAQPDPILGQQYAVVSCDTGRVANR